MRLSWFVYRLLNKLEGAKELGKSSFSQCGEDLIVRYIFDALKIPSPTYLDIGAHHPIFLSNTFLLYQQGSKGINIEPDPVLFSEFTKRRGRDTNLNIGIADRVGELPFFVMSAPTLNTFSEADALAAVAQGRVKIKEVLSVKVRPINDVLQDLLCDANLDFLTIDIEGWDYSILKGFDFGRWRPKVICAETITYSETNKGKKRPEIATLLHGLDYETYADTHINTIFVDRALAGVGDR